MEQDNKWWLKFISVSIFLGGWILLIILRKLKPETDLSTALYITIALSVFSIVGFFSKNIKKSLHKEKEEKVISKEDIMKEITNHAHNKKHNNLRIKDPVIIFDQDTVGSDIIYAIKVNLNLDNEAFIMIINASFSGREPTFLDIESTKEEVKDAMNKIARNPKSNILNEKIVENESTGVKITTKSTLPLEEKKEEEVL